MEWTPGVMEWILGVEPWSEILSVTENSILEVKLVSGQTHTSLGVNVHPRAYTITKCVTNA